MSYHSWIKQENEIKFNPGLNQKPPRDFDQSKVKEESGRDTSIKQETKISYNNSISNEV